MENITVQYIATKKKVIDALAPYCKSLGIDLVPLESGAMPGKYLLLVEPVQVENKHNKDLFALSTVWKPWLMTNAPDTRLIFAGFAKSEHGNYLNLLALPVDLKAWLEDEIRKISHFKLEHAGKDKDGKDKYNDPWDRNIPHTGRTLKNQMQKFIDGHDRANSLFNQINEVRKPLANLAYLLKENIQDKDSRKELVEQIEIGWRYLNVRWRFYKPFFVIMPFNDAKDTIDQQVSMIDSQINKITKTKGKLPVVEVKDVILKIDNMKYKLEFNLKQFIDNNNPFSS